MARGFDIVREARERLGEVSNETGARPEYNSRGQWHGSKSTKRRNKESV